jgi:hypothetical protein
MAILKATTAAAGGTEAALHTAITRIRSDVYGWSVVDP